MKNYDDNYRKTNVSKLVNGQEYPELLSMMYEACKVYNRFYHNKFVTYHYKPIIKGQKARKKTCEIKAHEGNFMHLCGVSYYRTYEDLKEQEAKEAELEKSNQHAVPKFGKYAKPFYYDCEKQKLKIENIWFKDVENAKKKLQAFEHIKELFESGVKIAEGGRLDNNSFEKAVRTLDSRVCIMVSNRIIKSIYNLSGRSSTIPVLAGAYSAFQIDIEDLTTKKKTTIPINNTLSKKSKKRAKDKQLKAKAKKLEARKITQKQKGGGK